MTAPRGVPHSEAAGTVRYDPFLWPPPNAYRIWAVAERIAALEAVVAGLREQLAAAERPGSRNSGNSSMPPSSDDLPGRRPPGKRRRAAERAGKKKRGKQPGSPGASMTWEVPDRTEDHYPEGSCSCGLDLADAADLGVSRSYQQEEIHRAWLSNGERLPRRRGGPGSGDD
jgi:hypothetical protein